MKNKILFLTTFLLFAVLCIFNFYFFNYLYKYFYNTSKTAKENLNQEILENKNSQKENEEENKEIKLLFVGDIMLSRGVEYVSGKYKNYPNFPFQNIEEFLKNFDLTIGNLESPITKKGPYVVPYSLVFNTNPKYVKVLENAGFDILTFANNHFLDKGEKGAKETMEIMNNSNLKYIGVGENCHLGLVKEIGNIKVGFLGYSYTGQNSGGSVPHRLVCDWNDFEQIKNDIENMKNKVDHIIVFTHTGEEYKNEPTKQDEVKMKSLIDMGVSAVVSSHPHVVQKVEKYNSGVIAYSLGNFVFDNQEIKGTDKGLKV
jgi:poly-gamma-glutamate synthesis protein (capsule biosynthesis protein)